MALFGKLGQLLKETIGWSERKGRQDALAVQGQIVDQDLGQQHQALGHGLFHSLDRRLVLAGPSSVQTVDVSTETSDGDFHSERASIGAKLKLELEISRETNQHFS